MARMNPVASLGPSAASYGSAFYITARLKERNNNGMSAFGRPMTQRLDSFVARANKAATSAAAEANRVSRAKAVALRPPAPPRKGRMSPPGALARNIEWKANGDAIRLDRKRLDSNVRWWIVQEIGTGNSATIKSGNQGRAGKKGAGAGRPTAASYNQPGGKHVRVKSQRGRRIPGSLAFGTAPGGNYVPPGGSRSQQLYLIKSLKGVPFGPVRNAKSTAVFDLRIKNEIKPKGFVKQGAREGFRDYRNEVVAAARATLVKRKR